MKSTIIQIGDQIITEESINTAIKTNKFKGSLFETVSFQTEWSLEYKSIFYEFEQGLDSIINEFIREIVTSSGLLLEAAGDPPADIFARFISRGNVQLHHIHDIAATKPSNAPKAKWWKWLTEKIKAAFNKLNRLAYLPKVDEPIQRILAKLQGKLDPSTLRMFARFGKLGGWAASATLLLISVLSLLPSIAVMLPASGTVIISAMILRVLVDVCQGKNVLYATGKAFALYGLGLEAKELMSTVIQYVQSHWPAVTDWVQLHPKGPTDLPGAAGGVRVNLGGVEGGAGFGGQPGAAGGTSTSPSGDYWPKGNASAIGDLTSAYGKSIPDYRGSFADAFRAARKELGPSQLFHWGNDVYPTNFPKEGIFNGLSDAVIKALQQGKK